jgi:holo-[acyl-carrier protein] synthase
MIAGIGIDIVDLNAFGIQLSDKASVFVDGTFSPGERVQSSDRPTANITCHLAGRFAAKEAFIKAWSGANWGRSPARQQVDMKEIEVVSDNMGRPRMKLHGDVFQAVSRLGEYRVHLSMSHDGGYASAVVLIELLDGGREQAS